MWNLWEAGRKKAWGSGKSHQQTDRFGPPSLPQHTQINTSPVGSHSGPCIDNKCDRKHNRKGAVCT